MIGPDLITSNFGTKPPTTKAGAITVIPIVQLHIEAIPSDAALLGVGALGAK